MNNPIKVKTFTANEAITDALYRAVIGLDTNNRALFDSAWINDNKGEDAVFIMNGTAMNGLKTIHGKIFDTIGPLDTTHFINNARVQYEDGADAAVLTCYALAQHYRAGQGSDPAAKRVLSGSMYQIDVIWDGDDDLWRMKNWSMRLVWVEGDMSIVTH